MILKKIGLLFFIFAWHWGYTQTATLDKVCLKHLGERANSLKVKTYATRMDEMEGSVIVLKQNGESVRGVLYFPHEKEALLMSGTPSLLYLRDEQGVDQGKMTYSIDNQRFKGELVSSMQEVISTVNGRYTQDVPVVPPACFVDKWLVYHQGHLVDGENVYMNLQRIGNGDLQGTIYLAEKKKTLYLSGMMIGDKVDLVAVGENGKHVGDIYGNIGQDGELEAFFEIGGTKETIHTRPVLSDKETCAADISKAFRYSIIYPKLGIDAFDDVMDAQAAQWTKQCQKVKAAEKAKQKYPHILNAPAAYSYLNVYCRDAYVFSGFQIAYRPETNQYTVQSINFDIRKKKFLDYDNLFESHEQLKLMVKNEAIKNIGKHPLKKNREFVDWVRKSTFENFVLQPDGVRFCTSFHPVFGQYGVVIPYAKLKSYIKNRKLIKHFRKLH